MCGSADIVLAAGDSKYNPNKLKKKLYVLIYVTGNCKELSLPSYLARYFRTLSYFLYFLFLCWPRDALISHGQDGGLKSLEKSTEILTRNTRVFLSFSYSKQKSSGIDFILFCQ